MGRTQDTFPTIPLTSAVLVGRATVLNCLAQQHVSISICQQQVTESTWKNLHRYTEHLWFMIIYNPEVVNEALNSALNLLSQSFWQQTDGLGFDLCFGRRSLSFWGFKFPFPTSLSVWCQRPCLTYLMSMSREIVMRCCNAVCGRVIRCLVDSV